MPTIAAGTRGALKKRTPVATLPRPRTGYALGRSQRSTPTQRPRPTTRKQRPLAPVRPLTEMSMKTVPTTAVTAWPTGRRYGRQWPEQRYHGSPTRVYTASGSSIPKADDATGQQGGQARNLALADVAGAGQEPLLARNDEMVVCEVRHN